MSKLVLNKETLRSISTEALINDIDGANLYDDWKRGIKIMVSCPTWCGGGDICGGQFSYTCG